MKIIEFFTFATAVISGLCPSKNAAELNNLQASVQSNVGYKTTVFTESKVYKVYMTDKINGNYVSTLHDVPLNTDRHRVYRAVIVIPAEKNPPAVMEISMTEPLNPIVNVPADVGTVGAAVWHYGAFPQTWEDPNKVDEQTTFKGDGGHLDVIVIGKKVLGCGDVVNVKILGAYPVIKLDGTNDWKMIAINTDDQQCNDVADISEVRAVFPGVLEKIDDWLLTFRLPRTEAKRNSVYSTRSAEIASNVVLEKHGYWKALQENNNENMGVNLANVTLKSKSTIDEPIKNLEDSSLK